MYKEGGRWAIKSAVGLGINLALLTVWVDHAGIPAEIAIWINWALLSVYGYVLAGQWVFEDTKSITGVREHARQWLGQQLIQGGGKVINFAVYYAILGVVDYRLAWVIGAAAGFAVSFGGNREWWTNSQPAAE